MFKVVLSFDFKAGEKFNVEKFVAVPQKLHVLCKSMPLLNGVSTGIYGERCLKHVLLRPHF